MGSASVYFMGANAAAAKQKDILDSGGTNSQAIWGGLAAGAAEVIFEKVSVGNLLKTKNITDIRALLNSTIKQAGVEASEEALTSISNIILDAVILGQNSDYSRAVQTYISRGLSRQKAEEKAMLDLIGQVVRDSAGGLLSGGFMGGTVASYSGMTNNTTSRSAETESRLTQNTEGQSENTSASPQTSQEQAVISASQNTNAKKAEASNPTPAQSALTYTPGSGESGALSTALPQGDLTIGASTFARSGNPILQALQNRQQEIQQAREVWRKALFSRQPAAEQNVAASAEVSGTLPTETQATPRNALLRVLRNGAPPDSTVSAPVVDSPALIVDGKSPPGYTESAIEGAGELTVSNDAEFKSAFAKNINGTLAKQGTTLDKFNALRLKDVATLSNTEKSTLRAVRESMPMPDQNTEMQKVIPAGDIQKYLDGTYTQVGGYVAKAEDVSHLKTYKDIYNSMRFDYPNSAYNPKTDSSLGIIRFKTPDSSQMEIPYSPEMGGTTKAAQPFTGNGFIKATNGQIIPELKAKNYMTLTDGSELYEISSNGTWKLEAIYDADLKRFIAVS